MSWFKVLACVSNHLNDFIRSSLFIVKQNVHCADDVAMREKSIIVLEMTKGDHLLSQIVAFLLHDVMLCLLGQVETS